MITLWDISEGKILMKEEYDSKTSIESLYTNGSGWYFGVGFYGYTLGDEGFYTSELMLYSIDKEGNFISMHIFRQGMRIIRAKKFVWLPVRDGIAHFIVSVN